MKAWMVSTLLVLFFTLITFSGLNVWAASTQPITKTSTTTQKVRQKLKKRSTKTINEQILKFAQNYPTISKTASSDAPFFMKV